MKRFIEGVGGGGCARRDLFDYLRIRGFGVEVGGGGERRLRVTFVLSLGSTRIDDMRSDVC